MENLSLLDNPAFKLAIAALLVLPTAMDREWHSRSLGLRTFPLVGAGACGYTLIGLGSLGLDPSGDSVARLLQGLMSGIGFVGGGAILKSDDAVYGSASAASIWITGAIGASVALSRWPIALSLAVINFLIVAGVGLAKRRGFHGGRPEGAVDE